MVTINVVKAFTLTSAEGVQRRFEEGEHEVEADIADHWYVQAHSEPAPPDPAPKSKKS